MSLEQVLADAAERVTHLKIEGHPVQAASLERLVEEVRNAEGMSEYLTWLDEGAAMLYEGRRTHESLRLRFPALLDRQMAKWVGKVRYFRRCALEHRGNADAARQAGRRAGRGEAA